MSASAIKAAIKTNLDALVSTGTLAGASVSDFKRDPLAADVAAYPHAFLMPPAIESEALDNRSNVRTYAYDVMVLWNAENIAGTADVEATLEAILSRFDNDPTLGGTAMGGVSPVSLAPEPFQHAGRDLVMAIVTVRARETVGLTF